jgi:hypothetical protein
MQVTYFTFNANLAVIKISFVNYKLAHSHAFISDRELESMKVEWYPITCS